MTNSPGVTFASPSAAIADDASPAAIRNASVNLRIGGGLYE